MSSPAPDRTTATPSPALQDTKHPKIKRYTDGRSGKPRYLVRYRKPSGAQTTKRGFLRQKDAEDWLHEIETKKLRGEFIPVSAGRVTVGELAPAWLDAKRTRAKRSYMEDLETAWKLHVEPTWGDVRVNAVTVDEVQTWITELAQSKSASVVIRARGILAGVLDRAVSAKRIAVNPARDDSLQLPRKKKVPSRYLTHAEVEAVSAAAGRIHRQYRVLVLVLAYCGLRWGEATSLRRCDVDLDRRRIAVVQSVTITKEGFTLDSTKSAEFRSVPIPAFLVEVLRTHLESVEAGSQTQLFVSRTGGYLRQPSTDKSSGKRWWESALSSASVAYLRPHDLRHTAASLAVQAGASVKALQRMLGHASATMTLDTYADLFDTDLDSVAEKMDTARIEHLKRAASVRSEDEDSGSDHILTTESR